MQKERRVLLNEDGEFLLYRAMVCDALDKNPNVKKMIDCDPWEFSNALDMSFEETRKLPIEKWHEQIRNDMQEFVDSWNFQNGMIH